MRFFDKVWVGIPGCYRSRLPGRFLCQPSIDKNPRVICPQPVRCRSFERIIQAAENAAKVPTAPRRLGGRYILLCDVTRVFVAGNSMRYKVREHEMADVSNSIALHGVYPQKLTRTPRFTSVAYKSTPSRAETRPSYSLPRLPKGTVAEAVSSMLSRMS